MTVIFGGAYQGKLDFAKTLSAFSGGKIHSCTACEVEIDLDCDIINSLHLFLLGKIQRNEDCRQWLIQNLCKLKNKIIICDDIFCGIVPMEKDLRKWREETGNILKELCKNADEVYRIFFGLETKLK